MVDLNFVFIGEFKPSILAIEIEGCFFTMRSYVFDVHVGLLFCISSQSVGCRSVVFEPFTALLIYSQFQNPVNPPILPLGWLITRMGVG